MKSGVLPLADDMIMSPPSRGAWIEMLNLSSETPAQFVAPLAGGVD